LPNLHIIKMRTSNKILLTILLAIMTVFTGIHVALYAKYKSGSYTNFQDVQIGNIDRHDLKKMSHISITGLENVAIFPADTFHVDIEKIGFGEVSLNIEGDSLILRGDSTIKQPNKPDYVRRSNKNVSIYVPSDQIIVVNNSSLQLNGTVAPDKSQSYQFILKNESDIRLNENDWNDSTIKYYRKLNILTGNSCKIELTAHAHIDELNLMLTGTEFTDRNAVINRLAVHSDSLSSLQISGGNLMNLIVTRDH